MGVNKKMEDSRLQKRKVVEKVVIYIKPDSDMNDGDMQYSNRDNIDHIKHDVKEIFDYSGNINEYHSDGSIVITPNYLENIPNEIIELILRYFNDQQNEKRLLQNDLYECALVNKQFYNIINPVLWYAPVISNSGTLDRFLTCLANLKQEQKMGTVNSDSYRSVNYGILPASHHLRSLTLNGSYWNDVDFSNMIPHFRLLEKLKISNNTYNITCASLKRLPVYSTHLTCLYLPSTPITESFIDNVAQHCHQLCELELCTNNIPPGALKTLANSECCTSLVKLTLYSKSDDGEYHYISDSVLTEGMIEDMARLDRLTDLKITGPLSSPPPNLLFTTTNGPTTTAWPHLNSLTINNGTNSNDQLVISFLRSHPRLESIHLNNTPLTDLTLTAISTHLPGLVYLSLSNNSMITSDGIYNLVRHCQNLKQASFQHARVLETMVEFLESPLQDKIGLTLADMENIRQRFNNQDL